jgi:hypothetical protein
MYLTTQIYTDYTTFMFLASPLIERVHYRDARDPLPNDLESQAKSN